MAYIKSRTVGEAIAYLALYILNNTDDKFIIVNEIL